MIFFFFFFFFKQKTAYEISVRDWSSDVCSSDLANRRRRRRRLLARQIGGGGSAQHAQQSNSAQHGDESGRAQQSKERSRHPYYDLHHANPLSLSKPSNDRPRDPYSPPAVE